MRVPTLLLIFLTAFAATDIYAATLTVTKTADTNDGVCDADCSLREAVAAAVSNDTVVFSSLFNSPQTVTLTGGQIIIDKNLTINGTGRDLLAVSGNLAGRIFKIISSPNVTMTGMCLRDGNVGLPNDYLGGAIYVGSGTGNLDLSNMEFTNNKAWNTANQQGGGSAVYCISTGIVTLNNVNIHDNYRQHGVIWASGILNITDSQLINGGGGASAPTVNMQNTIVEGNGGYYCVGVSGSFITITNSTIINNTGRGVQTGNESLVIENSIISGNTDYGINSSGSAIVHNSFINNNSGAGILNTGTMYITNSTISGNRGSLGGGIYSYSSSSQTFITNSTISGNEALNRGGGIYLAGDFGGGNLVLVNSTVTNNKARLQAGGIWLASGRVSSIVNSIISGNISTSTPELEVYGGFTSLGNNLVGSTYGSTGWTGSDLINTNPLLAPLANNGGPTMTHALLNCSPAKNAGNNARAVDPQSQIPLTGDQRGFPRIAGSNVDIGAYEAETTDTCSTSSPTPTPTSTPISSCDQNFDSVTPPNLPSGWTSTVTGSEIPWFISAISPDAGPNHAYATDNVAVSTTALISPEIAVPVGGGTVSFRNMFNLEAQTSPNAGFDGMVLEISIRGGAYTDIIQAGGSFAIGGYNMVIIGSGNPIAGRLAWSGLSGGTIDAPTYITTTVNLPQSANGQYVRLKWLVANDDYGIAQGARGVRIDSITGLICAAGSPSPTATATPTATGTATPSGAFITGTVTYGNATGVPAFRSVPNVFLSGAGSTNVFALTSTNGAYTLSGFGSGAYTVTPSKTGEANGISSFDSARAAQHASGLNPLNGNQLIVADTSGNGAVTSFDAAQIARYAAGLNNFGSTSNWIFTPANRTYPSVTTNIAGEDFIALLMGDVSGNWMPAGTSKSNLTEKR